MGAKKAKSFLKKELGIIDIFSIAAGAMISSGLFVLPGIAYAKAGPSVILSYVIASILIIPAILSKAELTTAMPKAGGAYFFIDRSMGPLMGTIGGFAAWFSLAFKSAFALVGIGVFTVLLNPGLTDLHIKLVAVLFCIIFTIVNILGTKHTGKIQILLVFSLIALLVFYVVAGLFFVNLSRFENFMPSGFGSIFSTAGLIFVSFGGITKVCSVAEECKKPGRDIPLGMLLAWSIVSLLYVVVIFVTIGVTDPAVLSGSTRPIYEGALGIPFFGGIGAAAMAVAAILAFVSTANAGILAASRNPLAMAKDQLLPNVFSHVSKRGIPLPSVVFTSCFMIFIILFLDLETLVKTASTLKILLFLFITLSLIIMRESKIRNYQPKFKSPFYPWIQIVGIIGFIFVLFEMGFVPMIFVGGFLFFGFCWYWFFARDKIWREYTLLHIIERVTGEKSTGYLVDEELREIIIDRDQVTEEEFKKIIEECEIIDVYKYTRPDKFLIRIAEELSDKLDIKTEKLHKLLEKRSSDSNVAVHPGVAIISHMIKGKDKFAILIVRSKMGLFLSDKMDPVHAFFIIVSSPDKKNFYFHTLMWLIQVTSDPDFDKKWVKAENTEDIRRMILDTWKKRKNI